jgi:hypothetical protein
MVIAFSFDEFPDRLKRKVGQAVQHWISQSYSSLKSFFDHPNRFRIQKKEK